MLSSSHFEFFHKRWTCINSIFLLVLKIHGPKWILFYLFSHKYIYNSYESKNTNINECINTYMLIYAYNPSFNFSLSLVLLYLDVCYGIQTSSMHSHTHNPWHENGNELILWSSPPFFLMNFGGRGGSLIWCIWAMKHMKKNTIPIWWYGKIWKI